MQKEIADKFINEVVKQTQKIKLGDPLLEDTRMGPLINAPHLERVLGFVKLAKEQVRSDRSSEGRRVTSWLLILFPSTDSRGCCPYGSCFGRVNMHAFAWASFCLLGPYMDLCSVQKMPAFSLSLRVLLCCVVERCMYQRTPN